MKKILLKICPIFILMLIMGILPLQNVNATSLLHRLYTYTETMPVIDGVLENTIWDTTTKIDVTLYNKDNQSETVIVSVMAVYDSVSDNITFGFIVNDTTQDEDILGIVFETNPAKELYVDSPSWGFGGIHDLKVHNLDTALNYGLDGYTIDGDFDGLEDTTSGGVNNIISKSTYNANEYFIEMTTELNSTELATLDFSLGLNDQINFTLIYADEPASNIYTQYRETDNDWDYCQLKVAPKPTVSPTISPTLVTPVFNNSIVLFGLVSTIFCAIIIARKRRR
jgi:hypothetical protein